MLKLLFISFLLLTTETVLAIDYDGKLILGYLRAYEKYEDSDPSNEDLSYYFGRLKLNLFDSYKTKDIRLNSDISYKHDSFGKSNPESKSYDSKGDILVRKFSVTKKIDANKSEIEIGRFAHDTPGLFLLDGLKLVKSFRKNSLGLWGGRGISSYNTSNVKNSSRKDMGIYWDYNFDNIGEICRFCVRSGISHRIFDKRRDVTYLYQNIDYYKRNDVRAYLRWVYAINYDQLLKYSNFFLEKILQKLTLNLQYTYADTLFDQDFYESSIILIPSAYQQVYLSGRYKYSRWVTTYYKFTYGDRSVDDLERKNHKIGLTLIGSSQYIDSFDFYIEMNDDFIYQENSLGYSVEKEVKSLMVSFDQKWAIRDYDDQEKKSINNARLELSYLIKRKYFMSFSFERDENISGRTNTLWIALMHRFKSYERPHIPFRQAQRRDP